MATDGANTDNMGDANGRSATAASDDILYNQDYLGKGGWKGGTLHVDSSPEVPLNPMAVGILQITNLLGSNKLSGSKLILNDKPKNSFSRSRH